jgi:hypothetical protein
MWNLAILTVDTLIMKAHAEVSGQSDDPLPARAKGQLVL